VRYFITGATGFIGGRVAKHLAAGGHEVRALVRSRANAAHLAAAGSTLCEGDDQHACAVERDREQGWSAVNQNRPVIGVTIGDPAGIGPEIVAKALAHPELHEWCRCVVYGQQAALRRIARLVPGMPGVQSVASSEEALALPHDAFPLVEVDAAFPPDVPIGQVSAAGGAASFAYVRAATRDALDARIDAIATAPIHKEALRAAGVPFIGHTEMLADLTGSPASFTMFMTGPLRIFFATRHVSLRRACDLISDELVADTVVAADRHLRRLGIADPTLAVAALNPHAGDGGLMGDEEARAIAPGIEAARARGVRVSGPVPADSVFHQAIGGRYDAVVSLYHDQGHIAAKVHDFDRTVSLTLGLPFLRTSVDHGTAFDIAGTGVASEVSMVEAIRAAARYARRWKATSESEAVSTEDRG
jgi:4-hydroxythreonine-4-phosphate dehydrogenase